MNEAQTTSPQQKCVIENCNEIGFSFAHMHRKSSSIDGDIDFARRSVFPTVDATEICAPRKWKEKTKKKKKNWLIASTEAIASCFIRLCFGIPWCITTWQIMPAKVSVLSFRFVIEHKTANYVFVIFSKFRWIESIANNCIIFHKKNNNKNWTKNRNKRGCQRKYQNIQYLYIVNYWNWIWRLKNTVILTVFSYSFSIFLFSKTFISIDWMRIDRLSGN